MGILTSFVAAEEEELESIGESLNPTSEWSGFSLRDVNIGNIVTLHCLLTGDLFDDAVLLYEPIYISAAEGALVLRVSDVAMERLTGLEDEALEAIASELSATEDFESAGWEEDAVLSMLAQLADLARIAESQGQMLFVWMHPLRT